MFPHAAVTALGSAGVVAGAGAGADQMKEHGEVWAAEADEEKSEAEAGEMAPEETEAAMRGHSEPF